MSRREADAIKLDFEDLVKELDQFEQDIQSLQNRIHQFMSDARQTTDGTGKNVETVGGDSD